MLVERWRRYYNELRPHSALGYRPPAPAAWMIGEQRLGLPLWGPTGEEDEGRAGALPYPYGHLPGAQVARAERSSALQSPILRASSRECSIGGE